MDAHVFICLRNGSIPFYISIESLSTLLCYLLLLGNGPNGTGSSTWKTQVLCFLFNLADWFCYFVVSNFNLSYSYSSWVKGKNRKPRIDVLSRKMLGKNSKRCWKYAVFWFWAFLLSSWNAALFFYFFGFSFLIFVLNFYAGVHRANIIHEMGVCLPWCDVNFYCSMKTNSLLIEIFNNHTAKQRVCLKMMSDSKLLSEIGNEGICLRTMWRNSERRLGSGTSINLYCIDHIHITNVSILPFLNPDY